jgi:hypothetical protein
LQKRREKERATKREKREGEGEEEEERTFNPFFPHTHPSNPFFFTHFLPFQ